MISCLSIILPSLTGTFCPVKEEKAAAEKPCVQRDLAAHFVTFSYILAHKAQSGVSFLLSLVLGAISAANLSIFPQNGAFSRL
ncbi:hypothetical protein [Allobaculum fili]|uniref:hypothetical protein n=1 Tax=Allobaculum fili TaxID=2834460 RepID=UPI001E5C521C|nr:hypothetical protein [Allobaculum fili]